MTLLSNAKYNEEDFSCPSQKGRTLKIKKIFFTDKLWFYRATSAFAKKRKKITHKKNQNQRVVLWKTWSNDPTNLEPACASCNCLTLKKFKTYFQSPCLDKKREQKLSVLLWEKKRISYLVVWTKKKEPMRQE